MARADRMDRTAPRGVDTTDPATAPEATAEAKVNADRESVGAAAARSGKSGHAAVAPPPAGPAKT
jgi:hypothetical protein